MLHHSTAFEVEHESVWFSLGYNSEYFARTKVWSGSYFIFITNTGRLSKWQLSWSLLFPRYFFLRLCTVMFIYINESPSVINHRLLPSSLPSYLYSLFESANVNQYRFITKVKYESHRSWRLVVKISLELESISI